MLCLDPEIDFWFIFKQSIDFIQRYVCFCRTDAIPPQILWAQRTDKVLVSIQLEDVTDEKITVDTEKLTFRYFSKKTLPGFWLVQYWNVDPFFNKDNTCDPPKKNHDTDLMLQL